MREQVNDFLRKSLTKDVQAGHQFFNKEGDYYANYFSRKQQGFSFI